MTARHRRADDLYGGGLTGRMLQGQYHREDVYAWLQKRHRKSHALFDEKGYCRRGEHVWKVPYGVRVATGQRLIHAQLIAKYPFFVTWTSPTTGKRMRKFMTSLPAAIILITERVQYADPEACVVSRHGFEIPPKLRGKFPRKMDGYTHYWCPRCMAPRRMRRCGDKQFYALKKLWDGDKGYYVHKEVKLALLECVVCGITNRDDRFRRSNQPYEVRRFKQGVRRAKRRRRR